MGFTSALLGGWLKLTGAVHEHFLVLEILRVAVDILLKLREL
jgi:hypothetical protein